MEFGICVDGMDDAEDLISYARDNILIVDRVQSDLAVLHDALVMQLVDDTFEDGLAKTERILGGFFGDAA